MPPGGVEDGNDGMNKDVAIIFEKLGIVGYECTTYAAIDMVNVMVIDDEGKLDKLAAAEGVHQRGKAKQIWKEIWAEVTQMGLPEPSSSWPSREVAFLTELVLLCSAAKGSNKKQ